VGLEQYGSYEEHDGGGNSPSEMGQLMIDDGDFEIRIERLARGLGVQVPS
jgi:hypothetical protein